MKRYYADELPGCGAHDCVIRKPEGQGTNGGCRCLPSKLRCRIRTLERENEELREALKKALPLAHELVRHLRAENKIEALKATNVLADMRKALARLEENDD